MNRFISNTDEQKRKMLDDLGMKTADELFADVPVEIRLKEPFALPEALSEYDLKKVMQNLAGRNISASDAVCFVGAGSYDHFVPSIVNRLTNQISTAFNGGEMLEQNSDALGIIYECQQYLARLCGMGNVNLSYASIADALAAVVLNARAENKKRIVVLRQVNPEYKKALKFICDAYNLELCEAECKDGTTSQEELAAVLNEKTALVVAQNPNYFGIIEDMALYADNAHEEGARLAAIVDPISLALLATPGQYDADYAIGSSQPLGGALSFGAPSFAFLAAKSDDMLCGSVAVKNGDFALVGNKPICRTMFNSVVSAAVYLSFMGEGLEQVARTCYSNAYYTYERLTATSAFKAVFNKPFFREFAVKATKKNVNDINNRMPDYGMIGGPALKSEYPELGNAWLVAVTEKRSADEVELFVKEASRAI